MHPSFPESQKIPGAPGLGLPLSASASSPLSPPFRLSPSTPISLPFSPPTAFLALHFLGHKRHLLIISALGEFDIRAPRPLSSTAARPRSQPPDSSKSYIMARLLQAGCVSCRSTKSVAFRPVVHRSSAAAVGIKSVCFRYKDRMEGDFLLEGVWVDKLCHPAQRKTSEAQLK